MFLHWDFTVKGLLRALQVLFEKGLDKLTGYSYNKVWWKDA